MKLRLVFVGNKERWIAEEMQSPAILMPDTTMTFQYAAQTHTRPIKSIESHPFFSVLDGFGGTGWIGKNLFRPEKYTTLIVTAAGPDVPERKHTLHISPREFWSLPNVSLGSARLPARSTHHRTLVPADVPDFPAVLTIS